MIHPKLATMLAVVTTDYPLEPGEAIEFLRPAVDASFNAISVDGECSTNDTVVLLANGASGDRAHARDATRSSRVALRKVCGELAKQIVADGEGATVLAEIAVRGAASDARGRARSRERVATSPLVKTALFGHDANWGRIARGRRLGAVQRRLRAARPRPRSRSRSTASPSSSTARRPATSRRSTTAAARSSSTSALGDGAATLPDHRPLLRLRPHQRGLPHVSRSSLKVGGASTGDVRGDRSRSPRPSHEVVRRARRRAADLGRRWSGAGSTSQFVGGRRVTTPDGARGRARELRAGQRGALRGDRRRAPCRSSATRSASRRRSCRSSGSSATRCPARPPRCSRRSRRARSRSSRRSRAGPLNVNADEAAAALARRPRRRPDPSSSPTSRASPRRRARAARSRPTRAERARRRRRTSRAASSRSCSPRLAAARSGVAAEIGETAVLA